MKDIIKHALNLIDEIDLSEDIQYSPPYCYRVKTLLLYIQQNDLCDLNYSSRVNLFQNIYNPDFISEANLDDLKTLLTCCHKGEHFSKGFFGDLLKNGIVRQLLHHMSEKIELETTEYPKKKKRALYGKRLYVYIQKELSRGASVDGVAEILNNRDDDSDKVWNGTLILEHLNKYENKSD